MNATHLFRIELRAALDPLSPAERVAWLERHGALPPFADIPITAPIAAWTAIGARVDASGTVHYPDEGGALRALVFAAIRETGAIPAELDATAVELVRVARDAERTARELCSANLRALAAKEPDFARAAAEGYPVEKRMLTRLAEQLTEAIEASGTAGQRYSVSIAEKPWTEAAERAAPRPDAFALRDAVIAAAAAINAAPPLALARWEVSRILRVNTCTHGRDRSHYVTAVVATLRTPLGMRQVTASLESQKCAHNGGVAELVDAFAAAGTRTLRGTR